MRNDEHDQEYTEAPPVRRCGYCGEPLLSQRRGAKFCTREHKELARQRRARAGERLATLRGRHPLADPPDLREDSDELDLGPDDHQDEHGIVGCEPGRYDPDSAWAERMAYSQAVEAIQARYERQLAPYRETMRRNIGVKPPAVARLEAARDVEIAELARRLQRQEALERAARMAPQRAVQAAERQLERAALNAFGRDLLGGSRRYQPPEWTGRPTGDIAVW